MNTATAVKRVLLNRHRLIAVLEKQIHIFKLEDMSILETIETSQNSKGLCELSENIPDSKLAFPANSTTGEVMLFDAMNLNVMSIITAHSSPIAVLKMNKAGTMLATASTRGTVIRVFDMRCSFTKVWAHENQSQDSITYVNLLKDGDHSIKF